MESEQRVADRYSAEGWEPLKDGAPDFLMVRRDRRGRRALEYARHGDAIAE